MRPCVAVWPDRWRTCIGGMAACLAIFGCESRKADAVTVPTREAPIAPAALGAVGAYARGGTPWTDRVPTTGDGAAPLMPPPKSMPPAPLSADSDPDGGVSL